jgi:hypothetical protein
MPIASIDLLSSHDIMGRQTGRVTVALKRLPQRRNRLHTSVFVRNGRSS